MGKRHILLDTRQLVDIDGNLNHRFWPAQKLDRPILEGDRPWERYGVQLYGTVLVDSERYRMWYNCARDVPARANYCYVGYAESNDGIRWEKPDLGIESFGETRATNLLDLYRLFPSVMIDPCEADPGRRYKATGFVSHAWTRAEGGRYATTGFYTGYSPDGLHWTDATKDPLVVDDTGGFVRDEFRQRYVGFVRPLPRYDLVDRRSLGLVTSQDLLNWSVPWTILVPDGEDDRMAQERGFHHAEFYGMAIHPYEDFLVGIVWVFWVYLPLRSSDRLGMWGIIDCQLVYSYDGHYWHRTPDRQPFISLGQRGDFDAGMIATAVRPVDVGDEVWIYYIGSPHQHHYYTTKDWRTRDDIDYDSKMYWHEDVISTAKIKRDRYASFSTWDQGSLTLRHGTLDGRRLLVNARAPRGWVKAQVLDTDGAPIEGFGLQECRAFTGDSVRGEITWSGTSLADLPADRDICLRFVLDDADLYAYQLAD